MAELADRVAAWQFDPNRNPVDTWELLNDLLARIKQLEEDLNPMVRVDPDLFWIRKDGIIMNMIERSAELKHTWEQVNQLADEENEQAIRTLITEAGIKPGIHQGTKPEDFTEVMVVEWVLGQWAAVIDDPKCAWMLNTCRNISYSQYDKLYGGDDDEEPVRRDRD